MGRITAIKPQKRPGRFNVFVEEKFAFATDSLTLVKRQLKVGEEISEKSIEETSTEVKFQGSLEAILHFLSFRPRSKKEIIDYFKKRDLPEIEQKKLLAKISELGLVDDRKFAEWWINQRSTFRPKGSRALKVELMRKGIEPEIIKEMTFLPEGEEEKAFELLQKNWQKWARETEQKRKEKAAGFLLRRGFNWETARKVIDRVGKSGVQ